MEKQESFGHASGNNYNPVVHYPSLPNLERRDEVQIFPQNLSTPNLHINRNDYNGMNARTHTTNFGPEKQIAICQYCHAQAMTTTVSKVSMTNHFMAVLLCGLLCWPCAWIPYCATSCKNRNHYCTNCGAYLGVYKA